MAGSSIKHSIDSIEIIGIFLRISGWAFLENEEVSSLSLRFDAADYTDEIRLVGGHPRPDVAKSYGTATAKLSGFVGQGLCVAGPGVMTLLITGVSGRVSQSSIGIIQYGDQSGLVFENATFDASFMEPENKSRHVFSLENLTPSRYAATFLPNIAEASRPLPSASEEDVSILVSLYKGREFLDDFFYALRNNTGKCSEIVIIDNGNDDPTLIKYLQEIVPTIPCAKLVRVDVNEGYIRGICHANAARNFDGHVVVLNTDIKLPAGWLERLIWPLDNLPNVATATPFTNAGTACSFPLTAIDNKIYLGLDVDVIDGFFRCVDPGLSHIDIPSGVGFTMAVHKDMLHRVGYFDPETFGMGYGEENDWCMRARREGWRDILIPNLFIYHKHGGVYPSEQKQQLIARNLGIINSRYPDYERAVIEYFTRDEINGLRELGAFKLAQQRSAEPPFKVECSVENCIDGIRYALTHQYSILFVNDPENVCWQAVLISPEFRGTVWGSGDAEKAALESFLSAPTVPAIQSTRKRTAKVQSRRVSKIT